MSRRDPVLPRWNIYARVLEDLLASRGIRLEELADRTPIRPMKVQRLLNSLRREGSFTVLSDGERALLDSALILDKQERICLRAALLATSIERLLYEQTDAQTALASAEAIFTRLVSGLQNSEDGGTFRAPGDTQMMQERPLDSRLESALDALDRAELAFGQSSNDTLLTTCIEHCRLAELYFLQAQKDLKRVPEHVRRASSWQEWSDEVEQGLAATRLRLKKLRA